MKRIQSVVSIVSDFNNFVANTNVSFSFSTRLQLFCLSKLCNLTLKPLLKPLSTNFQRFNRLTKRNLRLINAEHPKPFVVLHTIIVLFMSVQLIQITFTQIT